MKRFYSLIIACCIVQSLYSQGSYRKGYIISLNNDTIPGLLNFRESAKSYEICEFKAEDGRVDRYTPDEILGYRFLDEKLFMSRTIALSDSIQDNTRSGDSARVFLEVLVRGTASLYRYKSSFFIEKDSVFQRLVNKRRKVELEGKTGYRKSNKHIGILLYLFNDCPEIASYIRRSSVVERSLTQLVERYNSCIQSSFTNYKESKPWISFVPGIVTGVNLSDIEILSPSSFDLALTSPFKRSKAILYGLSMDVSFPRLNERMSIVGEVLYFSNQYISYSEFIDASASFSRNDILIEFKNIKVPLGVKYTFPSKIISPFLQAGISRTFHLSKNSFWIREMEYENVITSYRSEPVSGWAVGDMKSNQMGFWAGAGFKKVITPKLSGQVSFRYEVTNGIFEFNLSSGDVRSKVSNLQFFVHINF